MDKHIGYLKIPLQRVHVELTNVCDFNCQFCPKSVMTRPYGFMETDFAKRIITELKEKNVCEKITFHVMGEPTMHPDFFKILQHAIDEGIKIGLTTNGSRLGGDVGKRLLNYNLHQIDVSLQTPDERSFTLRRAGSLSFSKYVDGIMDFFASYKKLHEDTIFKFRFLNTRFRKKGMEKEIGPIRVISSTAELRDTFKKWLNRVYDILGVEDEIRERALKQVGKLTSYKWNVVEIYPNVFFETYVLDDWGHGFDRGPIRDAWAGYCFGMRDHFSILYNGDVTLCCIDYDGKTKIGNLYHSSLEEILSSEEFGKIMKGFQHFRLVHPYCKRCLGSDSLSSWIVKPIASIVGLKLLKPFFHTHISIYK